MSTMGSDFDSGELPSYTASTSESSRRRERQDDGDSRGDRRALYARQVQRSCKQALQRVKQDNALANSKWAEPLTSAPSAISVMAFLLKTAADEKAAGLTVSSLSVLSDGVEVGRLPSKYFHTNLQHCSNVGRLAFLDAQQRMNKINSVARSMMADGGSVSYIVELLEDPEDAKLNLKPELEEVRKTATECREECEAIKKKFEYWQLVIQHLSETALDLSGEKIVMAREVKNLKNDARASVDAHRGEAAAAEAKIRIMQEKLNRAIASVSRAQDELDRIRALPPIYEPSHYEDLSKAQRLAPLTSAPAVDRGWFAKGASTVFGYKSTEYRDEDAAYAQSHREKGERRQLQIIAEEKARRNAERERAEKALEEAHRAEAKLYDEIDKAVAELSLNEDKLAGAKASLAKANSDLKRLGAQKMELNDVVKILSESTGSLGELQEKIEPLILFFSSLENNISVDVMKNVDAFLNTISRNVKTSDANGEETASVHLRGPSKKRVLEAAFQIQGRFSIIADISAAYVQISNTCIREAINRMELLSKVSDDDWEEAREGFETWCKKAIHDIDKISTETSDQMGVGMQKRIGMLEMKAIEAEKDAAGDDSD